MQGEVVVETVYLEGAMDYVLTSIFHMRAHAIGLWTANAKHITSSWLRDGLKPLCMHQ